MTIHCIAYPYRMRTLLVLLYATFVPGHSDLQAARHGHMVRLTDPLEVVLKSARHPHEVVNTYQVHDLAGHGIRVGGREEHWRRQLI